MSVGRLRLHARSISGSLALVAATSSLLAGPGTALAQSVNSTSVSSNTSLPINSINFDFGSAAVATVVLVLLGLTALLVILAKRISRNQGRAGRQS